MDTQLKSYANSVDQTVDDLLPAWLEIVKLMVNQERDFSHLNRGEGKVLFILSNEPEGLSAGELSTSMDITTGRMANILHQLEKKNYIKRMTQPDNRRKSRITLTDDGAAHVNALIQEVRRKSAQIVNRIGREDAEELIRILKKLINNESGPDSLERL